MQMQTQQHPLIRLWHYARHHRGQIIIACVFSFLNKLVDLAPPLLIGMAVDIVVKQDDSLIAKLGVENVRDQLWVLAGLTLFIWIMESIFDYLLQVMWRNLAQTLQHDIRLDTYEHIQDLELAYFEDQSTGGLMSVLNDDVNQLERFLNVGANDLIQVATTVIIIGGMFFALAPSVAWMAMLPMPIIIWGSMKFQALLAPRYSAVRDQVGLLNGFLANNLGGIATIKSFTAEDFEVERIRQESDQYREYNRSAIQLSSAFVPLIRMAIVVGFIAIMVAGGQLALDGALEVGAYSVMVFLTQRLLWPLTRLGETFDLYQRAMASINRILNLLTTESQITDGGTALPLEKVAGEVVFEEVRFQYKDRQPILKALSMKMPAGKTSAIVGATGAGKSTVVKLLLRFYDVTNGRVTLDGHDVRDLNLRDLRNSIGLVSQDVFLFHGTVKENITYGTFNASTDDIIKAAKVAEAHEFIMQLPQGYDTIVGERGQKLSGGQRQRISIARAILKDPPILVLDEATSSVDNETEAAIQRSLEKIAVGRTTIIIAHRLSTIRNADRIFVLENGELRETGKHEDLIKTNGIYDLLWRVQTGDRTARQQAMASAD